VRHQHPPQHPHTRIEVALGVHVVDVLVDRHGLDGLGTLDNGLDVLEQPRELLVLYVQVAELRQLAKLSNTHKPISLLSTQCKLSTDCRTFSSVSTVSAAFSLAPSWWSSLSDQDGVRGTLEISRIPSGSGAAAELKHLAVDARNARCTAPWSCLTVGARMMLPVKICG
jgi:hypothetical protein